MICSISPTCYFHLLGWYSSQLCIRAGQLRDQNGELDQASCRYLPVYIPEYYRFGSDDDRIWDHDRSPGNTGPVLFFNPDNSRASPADHPWHLPLYPAPNILRTHPHQHRNSDFFFQFARSPDHVWLNTSSPHAHQTRGKAADRRIWRFVSGLYIGYTQIAPFYLLIIALPAAIRSGLISPTTGSTSSFL